MHKALPPQPHHIRSCTTASCSTFVAVELCAHIVPPPLGPFRTPMTMVGPTFEAVPHVAHDRRLEHPRAVVAQLVPPTCRSAQARQV